MSAILADAAATKGGETVSKPQDDEVTDFGTRDLPPLGQTSADTSGDNETSTVLHGDVIQKGNKHVIGKDRSQSEEGEHTSDETSIVDVAVLDDRLEAILLGTMSLGAKLTEGPLNLEKRKQLLNMTVLLSVEIVKLRRMIFED